MAMETSAWDVSEYLQSEADVAAYLNEVLAEGDLGLLQAALGDVAKARGMSDIAAKAGVGRESLYKSLSENGNPSFSTIRKVTEALGLQLRFTAA